MGNVSRRRALFPLPLSLTHAPPSLVGCAPPTEKEEEEGRMLGRAKGGKEEEEEESLL